jgi:hypothetical protein
MADSLSLAFLVLLETLSPEQRATFLLREVFDYPNDEIAAIVATSEQNARQLVARTLLAGVRAATTRLGGVSLREVTVTGQPGAMVLDPSGTTMTTPKTPLTTPPSSTAGHDRPIRRPTSMPHPALVALVGLFSARRIPSRPVQSSPG